MAQLQGNRHSSVLTVVRGKRISHNCLQVREELDGMIIRCNDRIARTKSGHSCGRARNNLADNSRIGWLAKGIGDGEEDHCQNNVHSDTGDQHNDALAGRFSGKTLWIVTPLGVVYIPILPRHAHKAANGQEVERIDGVMGSPRPWGTGTSTCTAERCLFLAIIRIVIFFVTPATEPDDLPAARITLAKTDNARRKTQAKFLHPNTGPFRRNEMTKFMHKHTYAKHGNGRQ